nr:hypothetical protein [Leptospira bandrabouensis]
MFSLVSISDGVPREGVDASTTLGFAFPALAVSFKTRAVPSFWIRFIPK